MDTALLHNACRFWSEVKKMNKVDVNLVNGFTTSTDIAESFANQYAHLFSSVPSDDHYFCTLFKQLNDSIYCICINCSCYS